MDAPVILHALPPMTGEATRLLVLGSLPSVKSLAAQEYYANARNQFWPLIAGVLGRPKLAAAAYGDRLAALREAGIGLWDAIASARRDGSLDSALRDVVPNDIAALAATLPRLTTIVFNGERPERIVLRHQPALARRYTLLRLPQSSPARAMKAGEKEAAWAVLRDHI